VVLPLPADRAVRVPLLVELHRRVNAPGGTTWVGATPAQVALGAGRAVAEGIPRLRVAAERGVLHYSPPNPPPAVGVRPSGADLDRCVSGSVGGCPCAGPALRLRRGEFHAAGVLGGGAL